jgi:hypothetical protein
MKHTYYPPIDGPHKPRRTFNRVLAVVTIVAIIVIILDLTVWRPL